MNTDKNLVKHIRIKDPITIGAIICLVGTVVLFVLSAASFFRVRGEEKNIQEQYEAAAEAAVLKHLDSDGPDFGGEKRLAGISCKAVAAGDRHSHDRQRQ